MPNKPNKAEAIAITRESLEQIVAILLGNGNITQQLADVMGEQKYTKLKHLSWFRELYWLLQPAQCDLEQGIPKKSQFTRKKPKRRRSKSEYNKYLASERWAKKREEVFAYRGKKCTQCGSLKKLHVHHLRYTNIFNEPLCDLIVLCEACHTQLHWRQNNMKKRKPRHRK